MSFDEYLRMAQFNPKTGDLVPAGRVPKEHVPPHYGLYTTLGSSNLVLYREDGRLFLRVNDTVLDFGAHTVEWLRSRLLTELVFSLGGSETLRVTYPTLVLDPPPELDPTAFWSFEDFEFGLFLRNLSKDKDWQGRLFQRT
jgi:hypothetical protein